MLIGLIMALIFGTGGAESEFASSIPHLKKEIRRHVDDKSRKDTLLLLVKDYDKAIKTFEKQKKKQFKILNKISPDREKTSEDFMAAYERYFQSRQELLSSLIDARLSFQEQISGAELEQLIEEAIHGTKREERQDQKAMEKTEEKLSKVFADLNGLVVKHIEDPLKAEQVIRQVDVFESSVYAAVDEAYELELEKKLRLDDKDASREEILEMYKQSNLLRYATAENFAVLRQKIINNTDEKEWRALNKELKVFLKN